MEEQGRPAAQIIKGGKCSVLMGAGTNLKVFRQVSFLTYKTCIIITIQHVMIFNNNSDFSIAVRVESLWSINVQ